MKNLRITGFERFRLDLPVRERMRPWAELLVADWSAIDVLKIKTNAAGVDGWGENLVNYSWGGDTPDELLESLIGQNPADALHRAGLGAAGKQALLDATSKALDVPLHQILGQPKVRDWCPLAWWVTKAPPEVLAAEAQDALQQGYGALKLKGRPFFDVRRQVEAVSAVTPPQFALDIDFNGMLMTPSDALPLLRDLDTYERVAIYESPTRAHHFDDLAFLRGKVDRPIAEHLYPSRLPTLVSTVDGFVVSPVEGWSVTQMASAAAAHNKRVWLQLVGTGITTAFTLHHGAVVPNATWPAVTAMNLFEDDLIMQPIQVEGGLARVPTGPGLGVQIDEVALQTYSGTSAPLETPRSLIHWNLGNGRTYIVGEYQQLWTVLREQGGLPVAPVGAELRIRTDDGTAEFDSTYTKALTAPLWTTERTFT